MKTEYKGFTIQHGIANSSDRFYVQDGEGKIDSMNFSFDGYATLGNAKGAITKQLKLKEGVVKMVEPEADKPADYTHPGKLWPFGPNDTYKVAHTEPYPVAKSTDSRNKREGHFLGRLNGHAVRGNWPIGGYAPRLITRKQRKDEKMFMRYVDETEREREIALGM